MMNRFRPVAFVERRAAPILIVSAFVGLAGLALAAQAGTDRREDALAIRREIESIFQAFIDKDRDKLAATHGRDWRGFLTASRSVIKGRDGYMAAAVGSGSMGPRGQGMVGYSIREYDTVFYGDVAIVNFVADLQHKESNWSRESRLTLMDVYAKEDGKWMQVASQTSYHPDYQDVRMSELRPLSIVEKESLLKARESVWRAWYAGNRTALLELLPPELVTLGDGADGWRTRDAIIDASVKFARDGGKLRQLRFPRTEFQRYGNTVIVYTSYELETERAGKVQKESGKATEIFVRRGDAWLNTGWQLAPAREAQSSIAAASDRERLTLREGHR